MSKKYSKKLDKVLISTTEGEDWVSYESVDKTSYGTLTRMSWDNLDDANYPELDEEWPYPQEG